MRLTIFKRPSIPQPKSEVLGINRRNLEYVFGLNPRTRLRLVDDKILAKEVLVEAGLRVPDTLFTLDHRAHIEQTLDALAEHRRFVVKPARGFGGSGVHAYRDDVPFAALGSGPREELAFHMAAILSGMYAMDAEGDRVLVEDFVVEHDALRTLHGDNGVSDVRVIVSNSAPVMAMLRLPCSASRPTANLHRGGIGVGIDLESGRTTFAVQRGGPVATHPDTDAVLGGFEVPVWNAILELATPLNRIFGMGYLGADIVLDARHGPLILEVNARPGLAIQLANRRGLVSALRQSVARER
jgi:alpha-L-glutamate ligase-like protein